MRIAAGGAFDSVRDTLKVTLNAVSDWPWLHARAGDLWRLLRVPAPPTGRGRGAEDDELLQAFDLKRARMLPPAIAVALWGAATVAGGWHDDNPFRDRVRRRLERAKIPRRLGLLEARGAALRAPSTPPGVTDCVVQSHLGGKSKPTAIGRHGLIGTEQARRNAPITIARVKYVRRLKPGFETYVFAPTRHTYRKNT